MQAVVFDGSSATMAEVAEPRPTAGQLLLEVAYCGICGSDLHAGEPDFRAGTVMGHEFSATVVEVGADVDGWELGDRVCVNPNAGWCGHCAFCLAGQFNRCAQIWDRVVGLAQPGGLASLTAVPASMVYRLPPTVSLQQGAWVEPLAVALRAVRRSGAGLGDSAVVFGAGPIGLLITMLLKAAGCTEITVVETSAERRSKAAQVGAHHTLDPQAVDPLQHFADPATAPKFAFECTGVAEVTATAVGVLRPGGRLTVSGFARRPPTYRAADLLFKEVEIIGSFIYVEEFAAALDLLAAGLVDVTDLTSAVVPLDQAKVAFDQMQSSPSVVKYLITPNGHPAAHNPTH